ncbi:Hypp3716 [Branchiostoma lanceolatum]|uniref:Hypp3716 protein n=1 Tax=Branchiostoma lanceolatum TaxID=7740 RepID=A0A8K0EYH5_BRALA|nr:Hypp3716 [Branchiostoma lanceolatum]
MMTSDPGVSYYEVSGIVIKPPGIAALSLIGAGALGVFLFIAVFMYMFLKEQRTVSSRVNTPAPLPTISGGRIHERLREETTDSFDGAELVSLSPSEIMTLPWSWHEGLNNLVRAETTHTIVAE